jgi:kynurenine 3-monooxygenase
MAKKITIAGAGLVGSLWAVYMARRNYEVHVFERRSDMRKNFKEGGRSINLALSDRGWEALEKVNLAEDIKKVAIPMYRRVMHDEKGNLTFQPYGKDNQAIYSVSRAGLNVALMNLAEQYANLKFHFDQKVEQVDFDTATTVFSNPEGATTTVNADLLFGTDGAYSAVRGAMMKTPRFNYSQDYIAHGYKELTIPAGPNGTHLLEKNALHIWPRGGYMLIALPNLDGSFTCTLFFPYEGQPSFESLDSDEKIMAFFEEIFPDALALMPDFLQDWHENPTSPLMIVRCYPWTRNGKVALMGDASHAIVPFYGQGMNSGFEDCSVLDSLVNEHDADWPTILKAFEKVRKPDADAIADLALHNFIEMRDQTADPKFLLQKKIEGKFSSKYPDLWMPLYSMVTFSHIRYSEAWKRGQLHDSIMKKVMNRPDIESVWESEEIEQAILNEIQSYPILNRVPELTH